MKVQVKTRLLQEAMPLLSGPNVYLTRTKEVESSSIRLISPSPGWTIVTQVDVPCTVLEDKEEEFEQKLPKKELREIINAIRGDEAQHIDLTWRTAKGRVRLRWGKGKGNTAELATDEEIGPKHLSFDDDGRLLRIPSDIGTALFNAATCADKTGGRANIQGVGIVASDMGTEARSMDGVRLYRAVIPTVDGKPNKYTYSAHLPADACTILGKHKDRVTHVDIDTHVFRVKPNDEGGIMLLMRVVPFAADHLNPAHMLKTWAKATGSVDFSIEVQQFIRAIKIAGLFANKSKAVKLAWSGSDLLIESWRSESGSSTTQITQKGLEGEDWCLLNSKMVLEMLRNVPGDNGLKGDNRKMLKFDVHLNRGSACTFSWGNEMYLILPMSPQDADKADQEDDEDEEVEDE